MKTSKKGEKVLETSAVKGTTDKDKVEKPLGAAAKPTAKTRTGMQTAAKKSTATISDAEAKALTSKPKTSKKKLQTSTATSPVKKAKAAKTVRAIVPDFGSDLPAVGELISEIQTKVSDPLASMSPVARLLAQPKLPVLERENRARLQMQSPTRLHFYWSVRENPWAILRKAFAGNTGSYTLVLKLVEVRSGAEQVYNAEAEGDWWFNVRPSGEYRAEIGFYAPNRPYIRIVYSNVVETPRLKPSPRKAADSQWTVSATKFAKVLNVAGFARDAFDVAVAGDDPVASGSAARRALTQFANGNSDQLAVVDDEDIRYAILAFAEGQKLDNLRWKISVELFDYFQASGDALDAQRAEAALREHFDVDDIELETEETGPAVFGASLVNFPRTVRSRRRPRIGSRVPPASSHSLISKPAAIS